MNEAYKFWREIEEENIFFSKHQLKGAGGVRSDLELGNNEMTFE